MNKQIREKLNQFLNENKHDKELIQFFKDLIKKNPKEFGFPSPNVDGLPTLIHGKLKSQAKLLLSSRKQKRLKTVMKLLYENQLNHFFDSPVVSMAKIEKQKEVKMNRFKLIQRNYDEVSDKYSDNYYKHSVKILEDWENNPTELEKQLIKLRNKVR